MNLVLGFSPLIRPDLLITLGIVGAVVLIALALLRPRGAVLRGLAVALLLFALTGPSLTREDRQLLPNVLALVVDQSASQSFDHRAERTEALRKALTEKAKALPGTELRT